MTVKKLASSVLFILTLAFILFPLTANAVVNWNKNATAVLSGGTNPLTDFDYGGIERPLVIIDGTNSYKMYYTGKGMVSGVSETRILYGF